MPRIPDENQLGYSVPRTRTPRFQDRSGEIVADAVGGFARTLGQAADSLQEHDDQFNYARAKSTLLTADVEARKELENDQDWETYEKRYSERMAKAREQAVGLIRGGRSRSLFDADAKLDVERGTGEIRGIAKRKEIDWGRASLEATLAANRTAALNATDEKTRAALLSASQDLIAGAAAEGLMADGRVKPPYLSKEEAGTVGRKFSEDYAESFVGMQPVEKRIELLSKPKGSAADLIAPDKRVAMLEAAKRESRDLTVRRESQAQEDAIIAKYGASASALSAARDIKDPEVRDSTVSRIKIRQAEAKQAEAEYHDSLGEEAMSFLNGGGRYADLPLKIKKGLKPSELNSLRAYAEQVAGGGTRRTNPETLIELSDLSASDPQGFGELSMLAYRDKLSDSDFEEFVDLQRKIKTGTLDGKATGFMSINQVRDVRLRELFGGTTAKGDKQARINSFVERFENELKAFKQESGKPPKADDARKILDNLTAEVAINWGRDKRVFELDEGDIDGVPEQDRTEIIRELQRRGKPVTDKAIISLYRTVNGK